MPKSSLVQVSLGLSSRENISLKSGAILRFVALYCCWAIILVIDPSFLAQLRQFVDQVMSPKRIIVKTGRSGRPMTCRDWLIFFEVFVAKTNKPSHIDNNESSIYRSVQRHLILMNAQVFHRFWRFISIIHIGRLNKMLMDASHFNLRYFLISFKKIDWKLSTVYQKVATMPFMTHPAHAGTGLMNRLGTWPGRYNCTVVTHNKADNEIWPDILAQSP